MHQSYSSLYKVAKISFTFTSNSSKMLLTCLIHQIHSTHVMYNNISQSTSINSGVISIKIKYYFTCRTLIWGILFLHVLVLLLKQSSMHCNLYHQMTTSPLLSNIVPMSFREARVLSSLVYIVLTCYIVLNNQITTN